MKPIDRINRNTEELFRAFRTISADNMSTRAYIETINGDIEETARLYPQDLSNRFEEFAKKWIDALVAEAKFQATPRPSAAEVKLVARDVDMCVRNTMFNCQLMYPLSRD